MVDWARQDVSLQREADPPALMMMVTCCFTSTETVGLLGTGAQDGRLDFHTPPSSDPTSAWLSDFLTTKSRQQLPAGSRRLECVI